MGQISLADLREKLLKKRNIDLNTLHYDPTEKTTEPYLYDSNRNVICYYSKRREQWMVQPQNLPINKSPQFILPVNSLIFANWRRFKILR